MWNLTARTLAEAMNRICALVSPQSSEFDIAGLTVFGVHSMHEHGWAASRIRASSCSSQNGATGSHQSAWSEAVV